MINNNFESIISSADYEFDLFRKKKSEFTYFPERLLELYRFIPRPASPEQITSADKAIVQLGMVSGALASKGQKIINSALLNQEADRRQFGRQEWKSVVPSMVPTLKGKTGLFKLQNELSMLLLAMEFFRRDRAVLMMHLNDVASGLEALERRNQEPQEMSREEAVDCEQQVYQELAQKLVAMAELLPRETREETLTIALAVLSSGHQNLSKRLNNPVPGEENILLNDVTEMLEVLQNLQNLGMPVPQENLELLHTMKGIFTGVRIDQQVHVPLYRFFGRFLAGRRERVEDQKYRSWFTKGCEAIDVEVAKRFFKEYIPECTQLLTQIGLIVVAKSDHCQDQDTNYFLERTKAIHLERFRIHQELYLQLDRLVEVYEERYLKLTPDQRASLPPIFLFADGQHRQFPTPEEFRAQFCESTTDPLFSNTVAAVEISEEKLPLNNSEETKEIKPKKKSREQGREEQIAHILNAKLHLLPPKTLLQSIVETSTFPFRGIDFDYNVTRWKHDTSLPLSTPDYAHCVTEEAKEEQIFRHTLPSIIYQLLGTDYSLLETWQNPKSGENDDVYVLRANLERHGKTVRGEIRVCFKKGTNYCYHSYFHQLNATQLVEQMFSHTWQPIDFPTFEEAVDLQETILLEADQEEELRLIGPNLLKILSIRTEDGSEIQILRSK